MLIVRAIARVVEHVEHRISCRYDIAGIGIGSVGNRPNDRVHNQRVFRPGRGDRHGLGRTGRAIRDRHVVRHRQGFADAQKVEVAGPEC